jgi:hypothetical protein
MVKDSYQTFSQTTGWKWTKRRTGSTWSTPTMMMIRKTHLLIRMWLRSSHNNNDPNNRIKSRGQTIKETNPRANPTTGLLFKGTSQ